ncbi:hypothetical protein CLU79DRAFT_741124 [Phycomyces nitens]|nr:hypothetical protein CLU79DRAFT_741124 [Phycomyces nitens]
MSFVPNHSNIELPRRKSGRLALKSTLEKSIFDIISQEKTTKQTTIENVQTTVDAPVGKSINILPQKNLLAQKTLGTNKRTKIQHVDSELQQPVEIQTDNTFETPGPFEKVNDAPIVEPQTLEARSIKDTCIKTPEIKHVENTFVEPQAIVVETETLDIKSVEDIPLNPQTFENKEDVVNHQQEPLKSVSSSKITTTNDRIEEEKLTLTRLRDALDIKLTFHAAQNQPVIFHKIQQSLCNSTRKNISLSHIAKLIYLAPDLYVIQAKALRELGRTLEAYLLEFGKSWIPPLTGKNLQDRKEILASKIKLFFGVNPKPDASVPEAQLPKIESVVDKEKWLERANLPPSVRAVLEKQEQRKEATLAAQGPKQTPAGSVKDRASALLERLRAKAAAKKK